MPRLSEIIKSKSKSNPIIMVYRILILRHIACSNCGIFITICYVIIAVFHDMKNLHEKEQI